MLAACRAQFGWDCLEYEVWMDQFGIEVRASESFYDDNQLQHQKYVTILAFLLYTLKDRHTVQTNLCILKMEIL